MTDTRRFAVITEASSGIGFKVARCCAEQRFDLLIAADEPLDYLVPSCAKAAQTRTAVGRA
jgi:short-subunit dehydrogenase